VVMMASNRPLDFGGKSEAKTDNPQGTIGIVQAIDHSERVNKWVGSPVSANTGRAAISQKQCHFIRCSAFVAQRVLKHLEIKLLNNDPAVV